MIALWSNLEKLEVQKQSKLHFQGSDHINILFIQATSKVQKIIEAEW